MDILAVGLVAAVMLFASIAYGWIGYMPAIEELKTWITSLPPKSSPKTAKSNGHLVAQQRKPYTSYNEPVGQRDQRPPLKAGKMPVSISFGHWRHCFAAVVKRGIFMQKNAGGGSTITQQLSKQLYSPDANSVTQRLFQKPMNGG